MVARELALTLALAACAEGRVPDERVWAADALTQELVAIEEGLVVRASLRLDAPARMATGVRLFALVLDGASVEARDLRSGRVLARRALGEPAHALAPLEDGAALLLGRGAAARVLLLDPALALREEVPAPGACALAAGGASLFVGGEDGALVASRGRPLAVAHAAQSLGGVRALVAAEKGSLVWVVGAGGRVALRTGALELLWERGLESPVARVVPLEGGGAWCVLADGLGAARLDARGALAARAAPLACLRVADALARADGGLLVASTGALFDLDGRGALVRTQGGFGALVGLAAAGRRARAPP